MEQSPKNQSNIINFNPILKQSIDNTFEEFIENNINSNNTNDDDIDEDDEDEDGEDNQQIINLQQQQLKNKQNSYINNQKSNSSSNINSTEEVEYQLYGNQVGGHNIVLLPKNTDSYIVKSAQQNELNFYKNIENNKNSQLLYEFLPKFYGTASISKLTKIINTNDLFKNCSEKFNIQNSTNNNNNLHNNQNIQVNDLNPNESQKQQWQKYLIERQSDQIMGDCLKLQNLTQGIKKPNVLDLKVGFTAPSEKHIQKFKNTTSSSHGLRICGLKVYSSQTQIQYFKDKYWGRSVQNDTLTTSLAFFFYNGRIIRKNIVRNFLQKARSLKQTLELNKGFLFKSSSLLLIYEGYQEKQNIINQNLIQNIPKIINSNMGFEQKTSSSLLSKKILQQKQEEDNIDQDNENIINLDTNINIINNNSSFSSNSNDNNNTVTAPNNININHNIMIDDDIDHTQHNNNINDDHNNDENHIQNQKQYYQQQYIQYDNNNNQIQYQNKNNNNKQTNVIEEEQKQEDEVIIKLIDFANIQKSKKNEKDQEIIDSVQSLIGILERILQYSNDEQDLKYQFQQFTM